MEIGALWSVCLTAGLGLLSWLLRSAYAEVQRISILLNKTREEMAREYVTKTDSSAVMTQIVARFDRIEEKSEEQLYQENEIAKRQTGDEFWRGRLDALARDERGLVDLRDLRRGRRRRVRWFNILRRAPAWRAWIKRGIGDITDSAGRELQQPPQTQPKEIMVATMAVSAPASSK